MVLAHTLASLCSLLLTQRRFVTAGDSTETLRLFYGGRREALREVLEKGFVDTGDDSTEEPIVLFEDPWHAAAKAADRTPWKARHGGSVHGLLVCRVCPGNTMDVPGSSRKLPSDETIDKVRERRSKQVWVRSSPCVHCSHTFGRLLAASHLATLLPALAMTARAVMMKTVAVAEASMGHKRAAMCCDQHRYGIVQCFMALTRSHLDVLLCVG